MPIKIKPERFSNPRRNKLSLMRQFIQLTLFGSIVHASNYHSNQPVTLDNEHLVVFQELGLMFNPSNLSDAWTENNATRNNANLEESVKAYMNSEHQSTTWPLNETQTLFNRKIDNYLKQIFELTTTDWEVYLAPLMFSYNNSFNRTFQTSPHFVIFGQHARQPAFNHGNWEKKNLGECPVE